MNNNLVSQPETIALEAATSEPREIASGWTQPSVAQMVVVGRPVPFTGTLISSVYLVLESSDAEIQSDLDAWDAAADQDFLTFESRLE